MPDIAPDGQPYVFISYASTDRERVREMVAALREARVTCWLDEHDIAGGANWGGSIADAIESCSAFVLMSSAASLNSRNVRQEIALAWQHDKPYIPLRLDPTPIPNDVGYWLATAQWIEVLDHPADAWLPKTKQALSQIRDQQLTVAVPVARDVLNQPQPTVSLPSPPSSFVGRAREVAEVSALLHTERIVTLVGPGGIGKTRVAIAVGHRLVGDYPDGVVFVDLAPLHDPVLVLPTIAAAFGVRELGGVPMSEALVIALRPRRVLIILDNVEHVIEAASDISRLVSACPSLAVLATSREPLRIGGEAQYPLAPLPLPQTDADIAMERLLDSPTIALFVQRARSSRPSFDLLPENAADIIAICQRLDGLPLAIELAAAQIRILPPRALADRLLQPMGVLTGGARDLPQRQRTMRDAIRWSYDLLSSDEQRLFRSLSVFIGGWTFESADAVVNVNGDLGIDLFDGLASLAAQSLIMQQDQADGTTRFSMLGMIREFAAFQLEQSDDGEPIREQLATTIERLATGLRQALATPEESAAIARLDRDRDNLRAVLEWCLRHGATSDALATMGLGIATDCWSYWDTTGYLVEGLRWITAFLAFGDRLPVERRIDGLTFAGKLADNLGAFAEADDHLDAAIGLGHRIDQPERSAQAMAHRARRLQQQQRLDAALALATESLAYNRAAHNGLGISAALDTLILIAIDHGDNLKAQTLGAEWLAFLRQQGDRYTLCSALGTCAWVALIAADLVTAESLATEAVALGRELGFASMAGWAANVLSRVALGHGDLPSARAWAVEGLTLVRRGGYTKVTVPVLIDAAVVADASGFHALARQLCVVAEADPASSESFRWVESEGLQRIRARASDSDDQVASIDTMDVLRRMTLDDAVGAAIVALTATTTH